MHLVGGASLPSHVAYWARQILNNPGATLPHNSFCIGRQYNTRDDDTTHSLYNTQQSSAITFFSVSRTKEQMEEQLEMITEMMKELYEVVSNGEMRVVEVVFNS